MNTRLRLVAVALAFLMPTAVFARWSLILPELEPAAIPSLSLPAQVGAWRSTQEEQLSDEVWAVIEPDAHVVRRYEAPGRIPIWLYLGLYVGRWGDKSFAHDPKVCYPAQGWEIIATEQRRLALKNSESLKATFLEVQNGLREEAVVYWFQPAGRWPGGSAVEQLMRVYDAVTGRPQYAFVRFSGPSDGSATAHRDLAEFASELAPAIRSAVDRVGLAGIDEVPLADL